MFTKGRIPVLVKMVSIFLVLTFSMYNVSFAIPEDNMGALGMSDAVSFIPVEEIGIAIDAGTVRSKYSGDTGKVIVHIQDAHCNFEAQSNINRILDQVTKECGIDLISVEGAEGLVDTAWFRAFPDAEIRKEVATYFMKKGEITGAEFFSIISDYNGTLFGAETREYYLKNLKAFTEVYPYKNAIEDYFTKLQEVVNRLKGIVYSPALKELDSKIRAFDSKEIELSEFAEYLYKELSKEKIGLSEFPNVKQLVQTLEYEKKIDFDVVDAERSEYIDELGKKMPKIEMTELVGQSIRFKKGHIKAVEFYTYLRKLAKTNDIPIVQKYPNLFYYYVYTKLYDGINNEQLFKELDEIEAALKARFFTDDTQRTLDRYSTVIGMYLDLVNIELTNDDYDLFEKYTSSVSVDDILNFVAGQSAKYNLRYTIEPAPAQIIENLPRMVDFYEIAIKRDRALIDNTLKQMEAEGKNSCVLIAGGFHTRGIKSLLEEKGVSYVVVTPKITKTVDTPYIKVLTNQRTSLEDIITESAMPGVTGITASREEIIQPKGDLLSPLNQVFYTIPLYLRDPEDLRRLSDAIGSVEGGRTIWEDATQDYREIVSALVRGWIVKVKEGMSDEAWAEVVKEDGWGLMGVYLKQVEDNARRTEVEAGFQPPVSWDEAEVKRVIATINNEFVSIFQGVVKEAQDGVIASDGQLMPRQGESEADWVSTLEVRLAAGEKLRSAQGEPAYTQTLVYAESPDKVSNTVYDEVGILSEGRMPAIIGDRPYTVAVQRGEFNVIIPEGIALADVAGQAVTFRAGDLLTVTTAAITRGNEVFPLPNLATSVDYVVRRTSPEEVQLKVDYNKTAAEKNVEVVFDKVVKHYDAITKTKYGYIAPQEMYVRGSGLGSRGWEQRNMDKFLGKGVFKITPYTTVRGMGLNQVAVREAIETAARENRIPVLVATRKQLQAVENDVEFLEFLKSYQVRVQQPIPDLSELEDQGWFFTREMEGTALLQGLLDAKAIEQQQAVALDVQLVVSQYSDRAVDINELYYLMPFGSENIPDQFRPESVMAWMSYLINNLLLRMPIKPFGDQALQELQNRRKVMWSV